MVVPNWLFDVIVFGVLLAASLLDAFVPAFAGAALLIAVCAATYLAAQELADILEHHGWWTQESVATATALSVAGFIYFGRNDSDLALLALSIVLMMASLMLSIALIACVGTAIREGTLKPPLGLVVTLAAAVVLGLLAGLFTLSNQPAATLILLVIGYAIWKVRENINPPEESTAHREATAPTTASLSRKAAEAGGVAYRVLIPQRGTLLDRFLPVLVLGALFLAVNHKAVLSGLWPTQPASASSESTLPLSETP